MFSMKKIQTIIGKALSLNSKPTPETFPELPDVIMWYRFVLAVMFGAYLGINDMKSGTIILQAVNLIAFVPFLYCKFYLGIEGENFSDTMIFGGLFNALAMFLLIWIYIFTLNHQEDLDVLASLVNVTKEALSTEPTPQTTPEEQEF